MARSLSATVVGSLRDAVPFLVIVALWVVVMLVLYGLFLATKPPVSYDAWVHGTVFVPPLVGFLGHTLRQALKGSDA